MMNSVAQQQTSYPKGNLLKGKKGLIAGVANDKSLAWAIAEAAYAQGAEKIAFTYQSDILLKRIQPLAQSLGFEKYIYECDVSSIESIDSAFNSIEQDFDSIDFIVHSIGFSDKNELKGRFLETSQANFANTMNISCYSLVAMLKRAEKLFKNGGSVITLSYYGAEKAIPNYNVMGVAKAALEASVRYLAMDLGPQNIRVNAISAGPMRTLAASGINDFRKMLKASENVNPLRRNTSYQDIGGSAIYLLSELGSGTTGEVIHVDAGFHAVGISLESEKEEKVSE
jgi:enoyl-[acyl-carrier protein] reductase I